MLRLRPLMTLGCFIVVQCGGGSSQPDAGDDGGADATTTDAAKDASGNDAGKDAAKDALADSPADVTTDVGSDAVSDASLDAAEAGDGGWTVTAVSGLVLWLDAAKGVTTSGSDITAWADQSGQGNNASAGTATPTLVSSSINSLPAAHFVSSSQQYVSIADATSLQWGTGDYYIAIVSKFDNDPTGGFTDGIGGFYTKLGTGSGALFFANDYNYAVSIEGGNGFSAGLSSLEDPNTEVQYTATYNDGTARLYAVQRASGTETLRVNASQVASSSSSVDVSESGSEVDVGLLAADSEAALDGDIAEVIAVMGTLSSTDLTNIEAYLKTKYAL